MPFQSHIKVCCVRKTNSLPSESNKDLIVSHYSWNSPWKYRKMLHLLPMPTVSLWLPCLMDRDIEWGWFFYWDLFWEQIFATPAGHQAHPRTSGSSLHERDEQPQLSTSESTPKELPSLSPGNKAAQTSLRDTSLGLDFNFFFLTIKGKKGLGTSFPWRKQLNYILTFSELQQTRNPND